MQTSELSLAGQSRLVQALRTALQAAAGQPCLLLETHISYVLVCGARAFKLKKALKNAFLDQSTLVRRQHACQEELRLNGRLARSLYLGVVAVTGTADQPMLDGTGPVLDWAVQMRAFDQADLWDQMAKRHALGAAQVDELARVLVPFHATAAVAPPQGHLGSPLQVRAQLLGSLDEIDRLAPGPAQRTQVQKLRTWEAHAFAALAPVFTQRLAQARVREGHGDLHLGNVTVVDGVTTVFDGIEFNDDFRWIDVMSDLAFMAMDLHAHGLPALAHRFVNAYLEHSGDYEGLRVFTYYSVHRALVRAKVECLRSAQLAQAPAADAARPHAAAADHYLGMALQFMAPPRPALLLTHGFSGSGKTSLTQSLVEASGAVRIRADVERKRLAGQPARQPGVARAAKPLFAGLYTPAQTATTYARLLQLAEPVLAGGHHAILDATFLQRQQRDAARAWAAARGWPCRLLHFDADVDVLRQRLRQRQAQGLDASDADETVLDAQLRGADALQADEWDAVFVCQPTACATPTGDVQADWSELVRWLGGGPAPGA